MFVQGRVMVGTLLCVGTQLVPSKQSPTPFVQRKVGTLLCVGTQLFAQRKVEFLLAFSGVDCDVCAGEGDGWNFALCRHPTCTLKTVSHTICAEEGWNFACF